MIKRKIALNYKIQTMDEKKTCVNHTDRLKIFHYSQKASSKIIVKDAEEHVPVTTSKASNNQNDKPTNVELVLKVRTHHKFVTFFDTKLKFQESSKIIIEDSQTKRHSKFHILGMKP